MCDIPDYFSNKKIWKQKENILRMYGTQTEEIHSYQIVM